LLGITVKAVFDLAQSYFDPACPLPEEAGRLRKTSLV